MNGSPAGRASIRVSTAGGSCAESRVAGTYTLGLKDQIIFPEVDYAKVDKLRFGIAEKPEQRAVRKTAGMSGNILIQRRLVGDTDRTSRLIA